MRRPPLWFLTLGCLALLFAGVACAPVEEAADSAPDASAEAEASAAAELRAYGQAWEAAYNAADAEALAALYAEDAVRITGGGMVTGTQAIREQFEAAFAQNPGIQIAIGVEDVQVSGDHAYTNGTWSVSVTVDEETFENAGKFLGAYHRQADGSWLARIDTSNADTPPPAQEGS